MVSQESIQATPSPLEAPSISSPRISFSAEFLDEKNFISINPNSEGGSDREIGECEKRRIVEFEFLSSNESSKEMITADELFSEGRLIPFWQMQLSEKLNKISLKNKDGEEEGEQEEEGNKEEARVNLFVDMDDDPSPRPPKCTVLWKEMLRLKKQRASSLSSSSTSSPSSSVADAAAKERRSEGSEKNVKKVKNFLERNRSTTIRIRPMVNVPICTHMKSNSMMSLFPPKKGKIER